MLGDLDWILPPETTQYGRAIRSGFRRLGLEPRVVHEVTDTAASLQLAAAGLGATVMTGLMCRWLPRQLACRCRRLVSPLGLSFLRSASAGSWVGRAANAGACSGLIPTPIR